MEMFLPLAFLFFIGSLAGWVLELMYRNLKRKDGKWINPGFCTGLYVPLYGVGLCVLYLLASLAKEHNVVVKYENIKAHIRAKQKWLPGKYHFSVLFTQVCHSLSS